METQKITKKLYRDHPNLFWVFVSIALTHFGIGVAGLLNPEIKLVNQLLCVAFLIVGLMIAFSAIIGWRKTLRISTSFGVAYSGFWFFIFVLGSILSNDRKLLWTVPLWLMFWLIHLIALAEPPYQELSQKDNG